MKSRLKVLRYLGGCLGGAVISAAIPGISWVHAQEYHQPVKEQSLQRTKGDRILYDSYILGPGDLLQIELIDLPEFSGRFAIGPDGTFTYLAYGLFTWKG